MARASCARGLSSEVKSSVSPGSISFSRKLSSVTRNGLANLRAVLIIRFMSFLFTFTSPFRVGRGLQSPFTVPIEGLRV